MKKPSITKVLELLDILTCITGYSVLATKANDLSASRWIHHPKLVWSKIANGTSMVWLPMVNAWINAGVHGLHVHRAMTSTGPDLNVLVHTPELFQVKCVIRGYGTPHIRYPYPLYKGPAWESVLRGQRAYHRKLYGVDNHVGRVYCEHGSHPDLTFDDCNLL